MTMTIVHLMQGNVPGLVEDAVNITLAFFKCSGHRDHDHDHRPPDARECTWSCGGCGQPDPCIFNVQDTKTMTMTIVHLMQGNVPGLVEDAG